MKIEIIDLDSETAYLSVNSPPLRYEHIDEYAIDRELVRAKLNSREPRLTKEQVRYLILNAEERKRGSCVN